MSRRIIAITVAIALATLGTVGGLVLVLSAEDRAQSQISDPITVAVAAQRIPVGTTGERIRKEEMVRLVTMPRSTVPADVIDGIGPDLDKLVVTSTIASGQLLLRANFGTRSAMNTGLALPEGMMAVTVATGAPEQVAGYVQTGSEIAIFVTYRKIEPDGDQTNIERTQVLLPRVPVLAVGTHGQNSANGRSSLMVTVAVNQTEAERLISAVHHGTLYLALLSDTAEVTAGAGVENTARGSGIPLFP